MYFSGGNGVPKHARLVAKKHKEGDGGGVEDDSTAHASGHSSPEKLWKKLRYRTPTSA